MSKNLIFETFNDVKTMTATRDENGFMHLEGVFGVCGKKNNNQRIYQKDNYAKMVENLQQRIANEGCPGELEHPSTMNITLENVSHKIDEISIDENGVVSGKITLLNTPKGKIAQQIVEGGLPLFISSRAQGNVDQRTGIVTLENLKTFDLVGSPGFSEARLHIHLNEGQVLESITENCYMISEEETKPEPANTTESNMNEDQNKRIEELVSKIEDLTEDVKVLKRDKTSLEKQLNERDENLKKWAMTDLSNGIQKWINEVYQPEIINIVTESLAPAFQKWIIEEYSPNVEGWLTEHFAPKIEKWITEEYSGELQNWIVEEFSPEIEKWIVEEYSDGLQGWINEHLKPEITQMITESKKTSLDSIDQTLAMLESTMPAKPVYSRKQVTEGAEEPLYIQKMPEDARVKFNLLNEDAKEMIRRRASLRELNTDEQIEKFWESIDFEKATPAKPVNEGLSSIADDYERQLRQSIRGWRKNA